MILYNFYTKGEHMKLAISSQNKKEVTGHAGKCLKWWIYEIENKEVKDTHYLELEKGQSFHDTHGNQEHPLDNVDILISLGMGDGMKRRLESKGIEAIITEDKSLDNAVASVVNK